MEMGQKCTYIPTGFDTDTDSSPTQSMQERRKTEYEPWNKCHRTRLLTLWYFPFVGGAFKVTFRSPVVLNLLTIQIPYLYDVSADEKQQIRRQSPGREKHTDNTSECLASWAQVRDPKTPALDGPSAVINSPNGNSVSMTGYITCRAQCKMKMPDPLFKNY